MRSSSHINILHLLLVLILALPLVQCGVISFFSNLFLERHITDPAELTSWIASKRQSDPDLLDRLGTQLSQELTEASEVAATKSKEMALLLRNIAQLREVLERGVTDTGRSGHTAVVIGTPSSTQVLGYDTAIKEVQPRTTAELGEDIKELDRLRLHAQTIKDEVGLYELAIKRVYGRDSESVDANEFLRIMERWEKEEFWFTEQGKKIGREWRKMARRRKDDVRGTARREASSSHLDVGDGGEGVGKGASGSRRRHQGGRRTKSRGSLLSDPGSHRPTKEEVETDGVSSVSWP